jgi:Domain of unknown function (DUF4760)
MLPRAAAGSKGGDHLGVMHPKSFSGGIMSLELVNSLATFGTFLVIAATALAAMIQLRHARSSNHIAALNELRETQETPHFQAALQTLTELHAKLLDPQFRYEVGDLRARTDETRSFFTKLNSIGNYYEGMGVLVKTGLVDANLVLEMWCSQAVQNWKRLEPVTAILRRHGGDGLWENFEYLATLAQDWIAAHPSGTYPRGRRRIAIKDEWLEADTQYAASLAPA